jgi:hypothetical protein
VTRARCLFISLLTLGCLAASVASAQACTDEWTDTSGGSWGTASNWSKDAVPGNSDEVCITAAGTYTVTLEPYAGELGHPANGDTIKSLTVGGSIGHQTLDIEGQSSISGSNEQLNVVSLTVSGGLAKINPTGTLMLDATASNRHGKTSGEDKPGGEATFAGSIENGGQIESQVEDSEFHNNLESGVANESDGNILASSGALKVGYPNTYPVSGSNNGVVTVDPGASLQLSSGDPSGVNTYENDGSVVNDGSITVSGAEAKWTQSGGSVSGNEVVLENGATLADSAGTGAFLGNHASLTVTGTIPAGQTVTVRGEPFSSGGEMFYSTTLNNGGKELVNDGTLRLNPTGSGETGGSVSVESGSIHNNGLIVAETETPTRITQLLESLTNGPSGRLEVNGGVFQGNNGALATNEGLVTVAPGALIQLEEAASFVNTAGGTFSPQIAGASGFGAVQLTGPCCNGPGKFTAGGTLAPTLIGGFVPAAGQEFDLFALDGGKFEGAFAALANGFTADYSHEASEPAFVGVVYGASAGGGPGGGSAPKPKPPVVHVGSISHKQGKPTVTLSCPSGGAACQVVSVQATVTEHLKGGKVIAVSARKGKKKAAAKKKRVVIATASATLAAGASKTLELTLNATGNALLKKYGKLTAIATVSSGATTISTATVHWQKATKGKRK